MRSDTHASLPAEAPAPRVQPSPLDAMLRSAAERCADPTVRQWLLALLDCERADNATTAQPTPDRVPATTKQRLPRPSEASR